MRYFCWLTLWFFGILFHITSSEFWPVTISKTWLPYTSFESSMLQKPLLTLFLALFHLLPLTDTIHIFLVKTVFSVFGVVALIYFSHFLLELTQFEHKTIKKPDLAALLAVLLVCISPLIRNNFFNIRSDQIAFLLFSFFLYFCGRNELRLAIISLVLIPCFGIKEIIFLLPGSLYFYWSFRSAFTPKVLVLTLLSAATILVWVVALNVSSVFYLFETFLGADYSLRFGIGGIQSEYGALTASLIGLIYIFAFRLKKYYQICIVAVVVSLLFLIIPQANSFFIASLLPIIFMPFLVLLLDSKPGKFLKSAEVVMAFVWSAGFFSYYNLPWYESNIKQLWFIEMASNVVASHKFTYLDGQGILPRQNFLPCFVSPEDDQANNSCWQRMAIEKPEALIITRRLYYLGADVFKIAQDGYIQLYPNFWIRKDKMNEDLNSKVDLSGRNPIPIIIF